MAAASRMGWELDQRSPATTSPTATSYNGNDNDHYDDDHSNNSFHWMALCSLQSNLTTFISLEALPDQSTFPFLSGHLTINRHVPPKDSGMTELAMHRTWKTMKIRDLESHRATPKELGLVLWKDTLSRAGTHPKSWLGGGAGRTGLDSKQGRPLGRWA